jgi:hypothetical protein
VTDAAAARVLATRLQAACAAPVPVPHSGSSLTFSASIGVTWSRQEAAGPPAAAVLLAEADAALYRAKDQGRGQVQAYRRPAVRVTRRRASWSPSCTPRSRPASSGCTTSRCAGPPTCSRGSRGAAALAAPVSRTAAADEFVPTAEQTGLLRPIGAWVLRGRVRAGGPVAGGPVPAGGRRCGGGQRLPAAARRPGLPRGPCASRPSGPAPGRRGTLALGAAQSGGSWSSHGTGTLWSAAREPGASAVPRRLRDRATPRSPT